MTRVASKLGKTNWLLNANFNLYSWLNFEENAWHKYSCIKCEYSHVNIVSKNQQYWALVAHSHGTELAYWGKITQAMHYSGQVGSPSLFLIKLKIYPC